MKEVTAVIKANVTVVYNVKDEDNIKTVDDFNREFAAAMRNEEPFTFDHIQAISVKNFVMDEPKKHCGRYPWESVKADTIAPRNGDGVKVIVADPGVDIYKAIK